MTTYLGLQYNDTATATLSGLKQDIYFIGKCNSTSIADGDLNRIINKYYGQLQEAVRSVNENFYLQVATTDLVIGDGTYTYPDGTGTAPQYEKIRSIWAAFLPANIASPQANEFQKINCIDPDSVSDPSYSFTQPTAIMFGTYYILQPLLTNAALYPVTLGMKIYYIATQNKLVNDSDVPKIFPSFHDAITQGALIDVAKRLGNDKLQNDSEVAFKKRLEDIKAYASDRLPPELGVIEGQDFSGGWCYSWGNNSMS